MHHAFTLGEAGYNVQLSRAADGYQLHFGEQRIAVDLRIAADARTWLTVGDRHIEVTIATHGDEVFVHLDGAAYHLRYEHPLQRLAAQAHGSAEDQVHAPMPGSLVAIHVKAGDAVAKGQALLVMESMKMETTLLAVRNGTVMAVHYEKGQSFDRDALLLSLEPM